MNGILSITVSIFRMASKWGQAAGYNREVCIDKMEFNEDGTIKTV